MLGFDWRKLVFEIINFAVFFFLIKLFLFKPVMKILKERQEKIRQGLETSEKADDLLAQAEVEKDNLLAKANDDAEAIKADALRAAEEAKVEIIKNARDEAEAIIRKAKTTTAEEREETLSELRGQLLTLVTAATKKVLGEALTPEQQKTLVERAVMDSLESFDAEEAGMGEIVASAENT
jgi:F-type H+-transporting ATPase subunit b